jgi:rod shape determining protein RodA
LGRGTQVKRGFLPVCHSDFIFSAIAEEWGFFGTLSFLLLYGLLLRRLLLASLSAPDTFSFFLCVGLSLNIAVQAFVNLFMALGLLPVVGLPLPLISYGGSNTFCTLSAIGMILSVARRSSVH